MARNLVLYITVSLDGTWLVRAAIWTGSRSTQSSCLRYDYLRSADGIVLGRRIYEAAIARERAGDRLVLGDVQIRPQTGRPGDEPRFVT